MLRISYPQNFDASEYTMNAKTDRCLYAEALRRFVAGRTTNEEYEEAFDQISSTSLGEDPALHEIYISMWATYCDLKKHKMTGKQALPDEARKTAERFILFLHSEIPYEWPTFSLKKRLVRLLTCGLYGKRAKQPESDADGDCNVWPFYRQRDYEDALAHPRLLGGR